jgi:hypothetical protein
MQYPMGAQSIQMPLVPHLYSNSNDKSGGTSNNLNKGAETINLTNATPIASIAVQPNSTVPSQPSVGIQSSLPSAPQIAAPAPAIAPTSLAAPKRPCVWQSNSSLLFIDSAPESDTVPTGVVNRLSTGGVGSSSSGGHSKIGCFVKSTHAPLVMSIPYAATVRERLLKHLATNPLGRVVEPKQETAAANGEAKVEEAKVKEAETADAKCLEVDEKENAQKIDQSESENLSRLFTLQRKMRAQLAEAYIESYKNDIAIDRTVSLPTKTPMSSSSSSGNLMGSCTAGSSSSSSSSSGTTADGGHHPGLHAPSVLAPRHCLTTLLPYQSFCRNKKQTRKDVRMWEKEERRKRNVEDDFKKRYGYY